jgi:LmbE family N-acetylglucosaminyl deacetylase
MQEGFSQGGGSSGWQTAARLPLAPTGRALVVVAHPDDETLWAGGTILMRPDWSWHVLSVCRGNDGDRCPRFFSALARLGGSGSIGALDDDPEQHPLPGSLVQGAILSQVKAPYFDLMVTHSPLGEYTRHVRHEEVGRAVLELWRTGKLHAKELWMFAYSDDDGARRPAAIDDAHIGVSLPVGIWREKLAIMQDSYGFRPDSWEAKTTPTREAFWRFRGPEGAFDWLRGRATRLAPKVDGSETDKGRAI